MTSHRPANSTQKIALSSAFIPDIICHGISLLATLSQVCRFCSLQAFLPTGEEWAEQAKEGPDIVHALLSNQPEPVLCYQHFQSHPNLECSEGSYSIPGKLSMLPNVYESTKANFCVLILENDPTNDKTVKVKIWV